MPADRAMTLRSTAITSITVALAVTTTAFSPAEAEELADETILVVGQRDHPISIEPRGLSVSLGEKQIAAVNAANVEDLVKYAPNVFVRSRFFGDNAAV